MSCNLSCINYFSKATDVHETRESGPPTTPIWITCNAEEKNVKLTIKQNINHLAPILYEIPFNNLYLCESIIAFYL